jgi:long-chain-fatty-acid--CoA ligase ACSBG
MSVGRQNGYVKRWISSWARDVGLRGNLALMDNGVVPYGWSLADYLVFQTVRQALGLDRCTYCVVTAAPVKKDTLEFFLSLNIPLLEIYGLSECSGPHTFTTPWNCRFTSVGKEMLGCSTKLVNDDKELSSELCLNGRNVFMGYLCDEEKTRATIDDDGWLHSGDYGRKDEDGFIFITGRLKEILITAGGENVAPVPIENTVKEELPCISNCVLIGDGRKFLSMLLTLKTEVCRDKSEPTDVLAPSVIHWCEDLGCDVRTVTEFIERKDSRVFQAIQEGIDRANRRAVSHAQNVQKWCVLPRDFSLSSGEFGPTMKLKRQVVYETFRQMIDSLYLSTDQNHP